MQMNSTQESADKVTPELGSNINLKKDDIRLWQHCSMRKCEMDYGMKGKHTMRWCAGVLRRMPGKPNDRYVRVGGK